jgi:hypothetical protein
VVLIVGIASFGLFTIFSTTETASIDKYERNEQEQNYTTLTIVTEKIHEHYKKLKFVVSYNSEKVLKIQINVNEEEYYSIKEDIASIAKSEIQSTTLKDYTVVVERMDLPIITQEQKTINQELLNLTHVLWESLRKEYDFVNDINVNYQTSITIQTSIKSSEKAAHKLAMKMEETVHEIIQLNDFMSVDSYKVHILDAKGNLIN